MLSKSTSFRYPMSHGLYGVFTILWLIAFATMFGLPSAFGANEVSAEGSGAKVHGEADLVLPDLGSSEFMGVSGRLWLMGGLAICVAGLVFGYRIFKELKNMRFTRACWKSRS